MSEAIRWLVNGVVLAGTLFGFALWIRLTVRRILHPDLHPAILAVRRRPPPFWTASAFLVVFGVHQITLIVLFRTALSHGWIELIDQDSTPMVVAESVINKSLIVSAGGSIALAAAAVWLTLTAPEIARSGQLFKRIGLTASRGDLKLGFGGAAMILPLVLGINWLASQWVAPYEHQVLKDLAGTPTPDVLLVLFVSTALVTPVIEEVLFRLLLQGGLQAMVDPDRGEGRMWSPVSHLPIVATSLLFAALHFDQGAAPIPLFFLSLGLGYLYRQTGSLTAPILVHVILNALTLVATFAEFAM